MPFVLSDPVQNEKELKELAKTPEGAAAIKAFDLEYELQRQLNEARKKANLTQEQLAERSGLKQQAVSRLEKGVPKQGANVSTLLKYVDALGCRLSIERKPTQ